MIIMKNILLFVVAMVSVLQASTQAIESIPSPKKVGYLQKSHNQKSAGIALVGLGTVGLVATTLTNLNQGLTAAFTWNTEAPEQKTYTLPYILSAAGVVGGITLIAASSKNKRKAKAASVFIDMDKYQAVHEKGIVSKPLPVAGLKIRL